MIPFAAFVLAQISGSSLGDGGLDPAEAVSRVLAIMALIAINAFFVTAEFSIVAVRRSRINQLAEEGDDPAKAVQGLQREIDRLLSTTQLGITLSSLALGWIGEKTMATLVAFWLRQLPLSNTAARWMAHSLSVPIAFLAIAYLQIVLGELCPKSLALIYSEELSRLLGPPSLAIARFFKPLIWILNQSTRWLLRLVGIRYSDQSWSNRVTSEELQLIISTATESSGLQADERELLTNVFEFGDVLVEEVMVPRTQINAIDSTATFQAFLEEISQSNHNYYPVIGESLDDIRGILHFKDLSASLAKGKLKPNTPIKEWVQAAWFVTEGTPIREVLHLMKKYKLGIVMVREEEVNGTAGLVTPQDLISEIIGTFDEPGNHHQDAEIQELDNHTFLIQAQTDLETVNDQLALDLPATDEYQTLGGFLIYQMQKIPDVGESHREGALELTVMSTDGPRLVKIQLQILADTEGVNENIEDGAVLGDPHDR
ncbi:DUF21 domain-containing protein [Synechococcales cyanobacterium C]|uniref:DUF21 domain-containing protein n=1 Tax=Petrachloros mirabilis ULC683 TaxID=2781853 RepID=A0A8K2A737_9CYAN|nr:hemolysin family protein [Petrachloros mirabilis]NCJ06471.1 DUF21 domain-containing protein [Petrachloros mirabilis ULC683]